MSNKFHKYKCPGAKRLMLEAQELRDNTEDYCAQPIEDNLFEWHFTVRGPPDTAFDGGYYHGRLSFPTEYPMKPPSIILLTPNGRFETNIKICLSISGYHPETWQPSWSVRTALLALIAFMPTKSNRAIGSLDFSDAERRKLAIKSRTWSCETCGLIKDLLVQPSQNKDDSNIRQEDQHIPSTSRASGERSVDNESDSSNNSGSETSDISQSEDSFRSNSKKPTTNQPNTSTTESCKKSSVTNDSTVASLNEETPRGINTMLDFTDLGRSFSPMILKSIFILLSLLILRRIVMIIQS